MNVHTSISATGRSANRARWVAWVLGVLATCALALGCVGCASSSPETEAENALAGYLTKIQKGDVSSMAADLQSQLGSVPVDAAAAGQSAVNAWVEGFSYELGPVTMDGDDQCEIETTITCRTLAPAVASGVSKAFANALSQAFSGGSADDIRSQTTQIMIDELKTTDLTTQTITVPMERVSGQWQPTEAGKKAVVMAMTGDFSELQRQLSALSQSASSQ